MAGVTELEQQVDRLISRWDLDIVKKKMFGGLGYMFNGNMAFGVRHNGELIVRMDDGKGAELLKQPGFHYFEMGGKTAMKNWYMAGGEMLEKNLVELLELGRDYALGLPPK